MKLPNVIIQVTAISQSAIKLIDFFSKGLRGKYRDKESTIAENRAGKNMGKAREQKH